MSFERLEDMGGSRLVLFLLGHAPFFGVLALAQTTHTHDLAMPEPLVAWVFHPNTIAIALAGLMGGLAHAVMVPPKDIRALLANIFFSVVSSVMLIPAFVDWFLKEVNLSAVMAISFLGGLAAQRLVPLVLQKFEHKVETILEERETKVITTVKEIKKVPDAAVPIDGKEPS